MFQQDIKGNITGTRFDTIFFPEFFYLKENKQQSGCYVHKNDRKKIVMLAKTSVLLHKVLCSVLKTRSS